LGKRKRRYSRFIAEVPGEEVGERVKTVMLGDEGCW
jgi:hypothetical protein